MSTVAEEERPLERHAEETRAHLVQELHALGRRPRMLERRAVRTGTTVLIGAGVLVLLALVVTWLRRR